MQACDSLRQALLHGFGPLALPLLPQAAPWLQRIGLCQYPGGGVGLAQRIPHLAQVQGQVGGGVVFKINKAHHPIGAKHQVAGKCLA